MGEKPQLIPGYSRLSEELAKDVNIGGDDNNLVHPADMMFLLIHFVMLIITRTVALYKRNRTFQDEVTAIHPFTIVRSDSGAGKSRILSAFILAFEEIPKHVLRFKV